MGVVVISYSRADQAQVRAIVRLLRGAFRDIDRAVYWDDDFEPGEDWFEQIKQHIDGSPQLFVFWCAHSAGSPQVRREFVYAIDRRKRVVPVLLDGTPVASELAGIHGIDLRDAIVHSAATPHPVPASSASASRGWRGLSRSGLAIAATICLAVLSAAAYAVFRQRAPQDTPSFRREVLVTLKPSEVFTPTGDLDPSGRGALQSAIDDVPTRGVEDLRFTVRAANSPAADRAVETIRRYLQSEYQLGSDKLDIRRSDEFTADDVRVAVSRRAFVLASTKFEGELGSPESVARSVARTGAFTLFVEVVFLAYLLTSRRRSSVRGQSLSRAAQTRIVEQFRGYL